LKVVVFFKYLMNYYIIKLYILLNYNHNMSVQENEVLVKITSAGTVSIPKQFRRFMDVQKGEYVKMILGKDRLIVRKVTIV
jgi:AbrB family looped-hinge helix DNA binding protein